MFLKFLLMKKNVFLLVLFSYSSLFFLQIVLTLILSLILENKPENSNWGAIITTITFFAVIGLTTRVFKISLNLNLSSLKLRIALYTVLLALCFSISYPLMTTANFIIDICNNVIQFSSINFELNTNSFIYYINVTLTIPFLEEVYYRKIILNQIETRYNSFWAILISSIMFSLFHMNYAQFQISFVFGLLAGYLYVKTRRIEIPVLLHSTVNFFVIITLNKELYFDKHYYLMPIYFTIVLIGILLMKKIIKNV